jgi:hypothetical protein
MFALQINNFCFIVERDLKAYFDNSFDLYETLFTSLTDDSVYYLCPDRLRLPLIFYYGHTAAVFINKLVLANLIQVDFLLYELFVILKFDFIIFLHLAE